MQKIPQLAADVLMLVGILVFAYGAWLAWHPLGFMLGGATLAAFGILVGRNQAAKPRSRL